VLVNPEVNDASLNDRSCLGDHPIREALAVLDAGEGI
jgi:hypothetical protein